MPEAFCCCRLVESRVAANATEIVSKHARTSAYFIVWASVAWPMIASHRPIIRFASFARNPLPEICRGLNRNNLEVHKVIPLARPGFQQIGIVRFHDLEARSARCINPACVVSQSLGHHAAALPETFADRPGVAILEPLDHHVEHARNLTPAISNYLSAERVWDPGDSPLRILSWPHCIAGARRA